MSLLLKDADKITHHGPVEKVDCLHGSAFIGMRSASRGIVGCLLVASFVFYIFMTAFVVCLISSYVWAAGFCERCWRRGEKFYFRFYANRLDLPEDEAMNKTIQKCHPVLAEYASDTPSTYDDRSTIIFERSIDSNISIDTSFKEIMEYVLLVDRFNSGFMLSVLGEFYATIADLHPLAESSWRQIQATMRSFEKSFRPGQSKNTHCSIVIAVIYCKAILTLKRPKEYKPEVVEQAQHVVDEINALITDTGILQTGG